MSVVAHYAAARTRLRHLPRVWRQALKPRSKIQVCLTCQPAVHSPRAVSSLYPFKRLTCVANVVNPMDDPRGNLASTVCVGSHRRMHCHDMAFAACAANKDGSLCTQPLANLLNREKLMHCLPHFPEMPQRSGRPNLAKCSTLTHRAPKQWGPQLLRLMTINDQHEHSNRIQLC